MAILVQELGMIFNSHGDFSLYWHEDILVAELQGGFNLEGVKAVNEESRTMLEARSPKTWQMMFVLGDETLLIWDSVSEVKSFFLWCKEHGCRSVVHVVASEAQKRINDTLLEGIGLEFMSFYEKNEAFHWLEGGR